MATRNGSLQNLNNFEQSYYCSGDVLVQVIKTNWKEWRNHINIVYLTYSHAILVNISCKCSN
jgi:hypothetical protein